MNRDKALLKIRPEINTEQNANMSESEIFQNNTLRPILKLQNDHLISIFKTSRVCTQSNFDNRDKYGKGPFIEEVLKKNKPLKEDIVSSISAMMTSVEFEYYQSSKSELNKRIINMSIERLKSIFC